MYSIYIYVYIYICISILVMVIQIRCLYSNPVTCSALGPGLILLHAPVGGLGPERSPHHPPEMRGIIEELVAVLTNQFCLG